MTLQPGSSTVLIPPRRLSIKEQALWTLQRLVPGTGVSNEALAFIVDGRLDSEAMRRSLATVVHRHPALRTVFPELRGEPAAVVLPPERVSLAAAVIDDEQGPWLDRLREFVRRPFDLTREVPVRAALVRAPLGDGFVLVLHHIVYDAWTAGLLYAELARYYEAEAAGVDGAGAFPDRYEVVQPYTEPPASPASLDYWHDQMAGFDPRRTVLAVGRPDPARPTFAGDSLVYQLSDAAREAARGLARESRVTESAVLLAAYYTLLVTFGGGPDLVVGVSQDARDRPDRTAVGYHVNTLPVRQRLDAEATPRQLVREVREALLGAIAHRDVPYEALLPDLRLMGAGWRTPLFRHMYNYRPLTTPSEKRLGGMPVRLLQVDTGHSRQDLEWVVESTQDSINLRLLYSTEIFDSDDVRALADRYDAILREFGAQPDRPLAELPGWATRPATPDAAAPVLVAEPVTAASTAGAASEQSAGPLVEQLVRLWREVLDDPGLGPDDNFFLSGGHSLTAARLLDAVSERLGVEVPLVALLDAPTPAGLARYLADQAACPEFA